MFNLNLLLPTGVVGVAQDVTEAAQHDRAVAAMANELRQLVDTANGKEINMFYNSFSSVRILSPHFPHRPLRQ